MAAPARHVSTFSAGMSGDVDERLQPPGTYRDARNLRLLYNTAPAHPGVSDEQQATRGRSLALEIVPGTVLATLLPEGYRILSRRGFDSPLGLIVLSTSGEFCEIGRIRRFPWSYQTLYNDSRDPNGDRLGLHLGDRLQGRVITENAATCRLYWTDNVEGHGKRVLNLHLAFDEGGIPYHEQPGAYPKHLSVHQMDAQPALYFPEINFKQRIAGSQLSGAYQLGVRYRTRDGHPSPWSPLTLPVTLMDQGLPEQEGGPNHHRRYFGSAGLPTAEGLQFELNGIDRRWSEVEVALLYHSADVGVERARLVHAGPCETGNLVLDLPHFAGQALPLDNFRIRYQTLTRVGTLDAANNLLYQGDISQQLPLTIDNAKFRADFTHFDFVADETGEVHFVPTDNPANPSRRDGDKLTNTRRQRLTISRTRYTGLGGQPFFSYHTVADDYVNFKGQLVSQLFSGYRRGETYGFAAVCRDDRGNAYFAQPLGEVTFPELHRSPTTRYDAPTGKWLLRSLGVVLSGIRIPHAVAHYPDGRLRLSSIEIVRTEASGRLGFQGVILPCTTNVPIDGVIEEDMGGRKVEPAIGWNNAYSLAYNAGAAGVGHRATHRSAVQVGDKVRDIWGADAANKAYWATVHAPDLLIEGKLPERSDASRLQLVGTAHKSTVANEIRLNLAPPGSRPDDSMMFYTKNYKLDGSTLAGGDSYGRPVMGSLSRIRTWFQNDSTDRDKLYEEIDPDNPKTVFGAGQNLLPFIGGDVINGTTQPAYRPPLILPGPGTIIGGPRPTEYENRVDAFLQLGAVIVKTQDWESIDVIESKSSYVSMHLVNFVQPPTRIAPADEQIYQPTGCVLRVTDSLLSSLETERGNNGQITHYVLNGLEVFGGDTYVNLFDFAQLYPFWEINCNKRLGYTTDYGVGRIVPIESKWNLALRPGRSLANNAFFPQAAACDNQVPHSTGGIAWTQAEDWNMAAVLRPKETIDLFSPQPRGTVLVTDRLYSIYNSEVKVYGEREDSFRKQLPNNYVDLDGTMGRITRLQALFGGVYCWQTNDYGRVRTFDRGYVVSSIGDLTTGAGKALDGVEYSKQGLGLQQFNAFTAEKSRAYWIDGRSRTLCRFSQAGSDELSERERAHDLLTVLLPADATRLAHVELTSNPNDKEVWVSWSVADKVDGTLKQRGTLVYSEGLDKMSDWQDLYPDVYLLFEGETLLLTDPRHRHAVHEFGPGRPGEFFGRFHDALLSWVINPQPGYAKKFDNLMLSLPESGRKALVELVMETSSDRQVMNLTEGVDTAVQYRRGRLLLPLLEPITSGPSKTRLWGTTLRLTLRIKPGLLAPGEQVTLLLSEVAYRLINKI